MTDLPPGYGEISADDFCPNSHVICPSACRYYAPPEPLSPEWQAALDGAYRLADLGQGERAACYARKCVKDETAAMWGAA